MAMLTETTAASAPRFDVVMALYNKREFVEAAVQSVLAQTSLCMLIVVDDGSTDGSAERVEALARDHERILLLRQPNAGVSAARNRGIQACNADYVAFLDADDLYLPGFLYQLALLAARFPQAGLLGTGYGRFSGDASTALEALSARDMPDTGRLVPQFFVEWSRGNFFFTSSLCVKRTALLDLGGLFPVGERLGEDIDVWFRMAERHPVAASTRVLAMYRGDVNGSLTASTPMPGLLPCYQRLQTRVEQSNYPTQHRYGARLMLSTAYLNTARSLLRHGKRRQAAALVFHHAAIRKPSYWLRVALRISLPTAWVT